MNRLLNDSNIQNINLKLDKDKLRELNLRIYLDQKVREGMNRKEAILQLFESSRNNTVRGNTVLPGTNQSKENDNLSKVEQQTPSEEDFNNI